MPTYKLRSHNRRPSWPARKRLMQKWLRSTKQAQNTPMGEAVRNYQPPQYSPPPPPPDHDRFRW